MPRQPGQRKPDVGTYDRNRRYTIEKGTREVSVVSTVLSQTLAGRKLAEDRARRAVIEAYEKEWGKPQTDRCQITHTHLTVQLITTLRVEP